MTPRPPSARPLWLAPWFLGGAALIAAAAPPDDAKFPPPAKLDALPVVFDKARPESVADLRAIEERTEKVYAKVKVSIYVLTAGHVSGAPGAAVTFVFHDGKTAKGKSHGRNIGIDSGMVRITDPGDWPALEMGKSADVKQGQWVMAVGHPGGYRVGRAPVLRLGRVLSTGASTVVHDCTIVGGDSGGPLFDMHGRVVGIESRIGTTLSQNTAAPVDPFRDQWDRLATGESFRSGAVAGLPAQPPVAGNGALLGVQGGAGKDGATLTLVAPGSPADKAGLMVKDVIKSIDGNAVKSVAELGTFVNAEEAWRRDRAGSASRGRDAQREGRTRRARRRDAATGSGRSPARAAGREPDGPRRVGQPGRARAFSRRSRPARPRSKPDCEPTT